MCDKVFSGKPEMTRKNLAKHVNSHSLDPLSPRLVAWLTASNRTFCRACCTTYALRQTHKCPGASHCPNTKPMPDSDLPPDERDIALEEKDAAPLTFPGSAADLPDMMEILSTQIPTVRRIPQQCRTPVALAYTTAMRRCSTPGSPDAELRAWKLLFMFSKAVLRMQPSVRWQKEKVETKRVTEEGPAGSSGAVEQRRIC